MQVRGEFSSGERKQKGSPRWPSLPHLSTSSASLGRSGGELLLLLLKGKSPDCNYAVPVDLRPRSPPAPASSYEFKGTFTGEMIRNAFRLLSEILVRQSMYVYKSSNHNRYESP